MRLRRCVAAARISIGSEVNGESIVVRVEDSGPGINPALRGRLFQPFVTAGKKNGLGLGLALSRQTLLDHGGDLWLDADRAGGAVLFAAAEGAGGGEWGDRVVTAANAPLRSGFCNARTLLQNRDRKGAIPQQPVAFFCYLPFFVGFDHEHSHL